MKSLSFLCLANLVLVIHAARIEAQAKGWKSDIQESQTESQGEFTLRVDVKEVVLNCTVLDSKGGD